MVSTVHDYLKSKSYREPLVRACTAGNKENLESVHHFLAELERVVERNIYSSAAYTDETGDHPELALKALAEIGAFGVQVPQDFGGLGFDNGIAALVVERIAAACASTAAILMFHYQVVNRTLSFAHPERRTDDLIRLATDSLAASAWTESNGKPKDAPATTLSGELGAGVVNGVKTFCTGLRSATMIDVLLSATFVGGAGPTFVRIDTKRSGVEIAEVYSLLGLRGSSTGTLTLCDVPADVTDVLGDIGSARELMRHNHCTPLNPGLIALGVASATFEDALRISAGGHDGVPARYRVPDVRKSIASALIDLERAYAYTAHLITSMAERPGIAHTAASSIKVHATMGAVPAQGPCRERLMPCLL